MKNRLAIYCFIILAAAIGTEANAGDCIKDQHGNVVCGEGQCAADQYGMVFCASAGRARALAAASSRARAEPGELVRRWSFI